MSSTMTVTSLAAPPEKTIHDLNGKWVFNRKLSDPFDDILELQGINKLLRKTMHLASLTIHITERMVPPAAGGKPTDKTPTSPPHKSEVPVIDCKHVMTAGLKGLAETRCCDGLVRDGSDWMFGNWKIRNVLLTVDEAAQLDPYLAGKGARGPWLPGEDVLFTETENDVWIITQVWGFQMVDVDGRKERRYVRNILGVRKKDSKSSDARLVYDWAGM